MKLLHFVVAIITFSFLAACQPKAPNEIASLPEKNEEGSSKTIASGNTGGPAPNATAPVDGAPRNVREFFELLPEKYFVLEGCDKRTDRSCRKAREQYLRTFTIVEDVANGYFKGGCDGGQRCIEMAIFKRPDGTYIAGVSTEAEMLVEQHFLDYDGGRWTDVSREVIPQFGANVLYELPRRGTTVGVFERKVIDSGPDFEAVEKGARLYDLIWANGKFTRK